MSVMRRSCRGSRTGSHTHLLLVVVLFSLSCLSSNCTPLVDADRSELSPMNDEELEYFIRNPSFNNDDYSFAWDYDGNEPPSKKESLNILLKCHSTGGESISTGSLVLDEPIPESIGQCRNEILSLNDDTVHFTVRIIREMEYTPFFVLQVIPQDGNGDNLVNVDEDYVFDELRSLPLVDAVEIDHMFHFTSTTIVDGEVDEERRDGNAQNYGTRKNHGSRRLVGQYQEYGIGNVNADLVWANHEQYSADSQDVAMGSKAKVCVMDTGLVTSHADLNIDTVNGTEVEGLLPWNYDGPEFRAFGHGTHVAGIIGAANNRLGVVGVAPKSSLHIIHVIDENNDVTVSMVINGVQACVRAGGVNVINMSFGLSDLYSLFLEELFEEVYTEHNILPVSSAGNSGSRGNRLSYPAAYDYVVSVGAADPTYRIAPFSTYNEQVDLAGPGVGVYSLSASNDNGYRRLSGTSMASPHVAGAAALLYSLFPDATSAEIRQAMESSARGLGPCGSDFKYGHGHVDAKASADFMWKMYQAGGSLSMEEFTACRATTVEIQLDDWGDEIRWYIANPQGIPIAEGGTYSSFFPSLEIHDLRLPDLPPGECYTFVIEDEGGDGLCCRHGEGWFTVSHDCVQEISSSFAWSAKESYQFGCGKESSIPPSNDCVPTEIPSDLPSSSPSSSPRASSPSTPPRSCYTDLDEVLAMELAVEDTSVPRTYILCPDTDFVIGRNNENGPGYVGGFAPLLPRANAAYKCGESGSSSNNCVLLDGSFQMVSFTTSFDEVHANVTFQGMTFEAGFQGSVLLANPGDMTFLDCRFRNHQNVGPVIILYDSRLTRLLKDTSSRYGHREAAERVTKMIVTGEDAESVRRIRRSDEAHGRLLQVDDPSSVNSLTVAFMDCLFEGNLGVPLDGQVVRPGIVTAQFPNDILVFNNTIFRDNDYGRISIQHTGWAINTGGPLTIQNTCFIDNNFRREAPVIVIDDQPVVTNGNYGTNDDDVACQFLAQFPTDESLASLVNFTCVEYDAETCQATEVTLT